MPVKLSFRYPFVKVTSGMATEQAETEAYVPPAPEGMLFNEEDRPRFSMVQADRMLSDPKITIGLAMRDAMLINADIKVEGGHPEIEEFIEDMWSTLWTTSAHLILRTKVHGFRAFEPIYSLAPRGHRWEGKYIITGVKDFHPRHTTPLVHNGRVVGTRVRNVGGHSKGKVDLFGLKSLWTTFAAEYGSFFGTSLLYHAYEPWYEKWMRGGAIEMRRLRMQKDSYRSDYMEYSYGKTIKDISGRVISMKEIGRGITDALRAGATVGIPNNMSGEGPTATRWLEWKPGQQISGSHESRNYPRELDEEQLEGLQVPMEVLEAATSGSGFSGRAVPFNAFLGVLQPELTCYVADIDRQLLRPLAWVNFGMEPVYHVTPVSLIKTIGEQMKNLEQGGDGTVGRTQSDVDLFPRASSLTQFHDDPNIDNRSGAISPQHGCTIGGVYYSENRYIPGTHLRHATAAERDRLAA